MTTEAVILIDDVYYSTVVEMILMGFSDQRGIYIRTFVALMTGEIRFIAEDQHQYIQHDPS